MEKRGWSGGGIDWSFTLPVLFALPSIFLSFFIHLFSRLPHSLDSLVIIGNDSVFSRNDYLTLNVPLGVNIYLLSSLSLLCLSPPLSLSQFPEFNQTQSIPAQSLHTGAKRRDREEFLVDAEPRRWEDGKRTQTTCSHHRQWHSLPEDQGSHQPEESGTCRRRTGAESGGWTCITGFPRAWQSSRERRRGHGG